jgi:tRNA(Ile)-lysidine synthase
VLVARKQLGDIFKPIGEVNHLALAVSGGADSMALLRMAHEWANENTTLVALTVHHGLRAEAAAEALQVGLWCKQLGILHVVLQWHHAEIRTGIQAKARAARYKLMSDWCLENGFSVLLTAHTADDQAETVVMRTARTKSAASLAGIWPVRDWNGIRVVRPVLHLRRQQLRDYLNRVGQGWVEDPSNSDEAFERVRVRRALNGHVHDFVKQAEHAQMQISAQGQVSAAWASQHFIIHETGYLTVNRKAFDLLDDGLGEAAVKRMIDCCGTHPRKTEREEHFALLHWLHGEGQGRRCLGGAVFVKRREVVLVGREVGRIAGVGVSVAQGEDVVWDDRFVLNVPPNAQVLPIGHIAGLKRRQDLPAFVQAGLPAVVKDGKLWSVPHLGIGQKLPVKFLRV